MGLSIAAPSALQTQQALARGDVTAQQVAEDTLARIAALEPQVHAWQLLMAEPALSQARALDARPPGTHTAHPLAGVPIGVKDIFDVAGVPTGCGSPIHRDAVAAGDAHVVAAARAAGALIMGKTVTTEFAYFTPGPTANPKGLAHTPGGSSSGSAAAVACGMVPLAFGSQTAGSLIRPASYCGVFALKPSHAQFSLHGVHPFAPSLDTLGWLAREADDLELMRCALAGEAFRTLAPAPLSGLRLMASTTHEAAALDSGGKAAWHEGLERLTTAGAAPTPFTMPDELTGLLDAQKTVMAWEAVRSLAPELQGHRAQLSTALRALLETGASVTDAQYREAQALAAQGRHWAADLMRDVDALVVPAAPGEAPAGLTATGDPVFSRVWTLLGLPCVNLPGLCGPQGLPVGLQLVGHHGQERALLTVAASLQPALQS